MDILVYDDFVRIAETGTDNKRTFPKNAYNAELKNGIIRILEAGTDIVQYRIKSISEVDSITDNQTGGAGVVAVPATLTLLFDIIEPYFFMSMANIEVSVGNIDVNTDDLEKGVWDKIPGNSKEFNFHVGVDATYNPSGSTDNIDTIIFKTGITTIATQKFKWDVNDKIVSITAS